MEDTYKTIEKPSEGLFKDKGSKFISFAFPVNSEDEIKDIVQSIKKEHHSARHHCYAWRLGADHLHFRANDDGEPSSTAGKPILGQIQSFDLTNILIVVVRYFGGTLLGVSGLINAYRSAALDAINQAEIV
ncbi:MAG: YigZ family protein, partial [Bacteroidota bacterium]|nr:YigZ family protein [Bacteroidota bacterium]